MSSISEIKLADLNGEYEEVFETEVAYVAAKSHEKRGIRKHHEYRIREKRSNHHLTQWAKANGNKRALGIHYYTPALCSCPMCGNPRKWFKDRTVAEKRFYQRERAKGLREE